MAGGNVGPAKKGAKYYWFIGLGILIVAVVLMATGKHAPEEPKAEAAATIEAETVVVSASSLPDNVSASGTVRPNVESKIAPKIMSSVAAVLVREGDHVRQGQVLIRLESRDLQAQVAQAEAAVAAAMAGSNRAETGAGLQKVQTSTSIANAEAALKAAQEQLSIVKEGPRKQQRTQAQLAVAQAEAQFKNAELELNRYKRLYEQDVVPKQRLDSVQTAYDIAKAQYASAKEQSSLTEEGSREQEIRAAQQQVLQAEQALRLAKASSAQDSMSAREAQVAASQTRQARAALEFARTQLGYATITSPISGVVSARMVDPGDTVSPGLPIITVQSASKHRLEATVPESGVDDLFVGKLVSVELGADKRTASGKVSVISPAGDSSSHKFLVKVDLPDSLNARTGEFGRIYYPVGFSKGVIIPLAALRDQGGLPVVFVVDKQGFARMQAVKVGRTSEGGVEILTGLHDDDQIIIKNSGVLVDGVKVNLKKSGSAGDGVQQ